MRKDLIIEKLDMFFASEFEKECLLFCTVEDENEKGVFNSEVKFFCLLGSENNDDMELLYLYPYVAKNSDGIYYGWCDDNGNVFYNNTPEFLVYDSVYDLIVYGFLKEN